MGWDAYAQATSGSMLATVYGEDALEDLILDEAFREAVSLAQRLSDGTVDGDLRVGGLDCSACAKAIEAATGVSAWSEEDWSPAYVQELARQAKWGKDGPLTWAEASAKVFLETCAQHGLGIHFSW